MDSSHLIFAFNALGSLNTEVGIGETVLKAVEAGSTPSQYFRLQKVRARFHSTGIAPVLLMPWGPDKANRGWVRLGCWRYVYFRKWQ